MLSRRTPASLLLLTLTLAACGAPGAGPAPAAPAPFDPRAALAASASGIEAGNYSFGLTTPGQSVTGILDAPARRLETESTQEFGGLETTTRAVVAGDDRYLKMTTRGDTWDEQRARAEALKKSKDRRVRERYTTMSEVFDLLGGAYWMPVDDRRQAPGPDLDPARPDVLGVKALLGYVETAAGDATRITGSVDASRLRESPDLLGIAAKQALSADNGGSMPYAATLTGGRLTRLELTMPGDAGTWIVELGDYGTARPAPAPAASEVKQPSAEVLELLGHDADIRGA